MESTYSSFAEFNMRQPKFDIFLESELRQLKRTKPKLGLKHLREMSAGEIFKKFSCQSVFGSSVLLRKQVDLALTSP